jgi:hypothetical protein
MAFAESFVECMQGSGVNVDAGAVSDESTLEESVKYVKSWLDGLDGTTKEAIDDASTNPEKVAELLVEANVAPAIPDLMKAFDGSSGVPLSTFLDWCIHCIEQAKSGTEGT